DYYCSSWDTSGNHRIF
nr:immunoglobulin light chain junction region [Macaca mulatta]MOX17488.1 immunoglobulin light chain junction region [Macaca mulatta]MOX17686.1 immunoglobulin light chain junction region [Macaca mulatta]MOX18660.1 immunoglobulin light chain junction region [Macaca mulatta]MOX18667.1 immunoglobulin light chain junction region [Macaca mulatta]